MFNGVSVAKIPKDNQKITKFARNILELRSTYRTKEQKRIVVFELIKEPLWLVLV